MTSSKETQIVANRCKSSQLRIFSLFPPRPFKTMVSIPVDVLRMILEYLDPDDLATMCLLNKICCSCSQDVLYRNVDGGSLACRTLAQHTHLARRVHAFERDAFGQPDDGSITANAFRNMSSLRHLVISGIDPYVLEGCTFKLVSLDCDFDDNEGFRKFLNSQPGITDIVLYSAPNDSCPFDESSLPNLTRITTFPPWLPHLIPGRPVREVTLLDGGHGRLGFDLSVFTLSATPIWKLTIDHTLLNPTTPGPLLAQIFLSLTHLSIHMDSFFVCDLTIYSN
jgi:hypothetical protein